MSVCKKKIFSEQNYLKVNLWQNQTARKAWSWHIASQLYDSSVLFLLFHAICVLFSDLAMLTI